MGAVVPRAKHAVLDGLSAARVSNGSGYSICS